MQKILDYFIRNAREQGLDVHFAQIWKDNECRAAYQQVSTKTRLNMWSVSKGVVSCAAGIAEQEGILNLQEKIADIFPEYYFKGGNDYIGRVTIEHLLTMTSGLKHPLFFADSQEFYEVQNWIEYFFKADFAYEPGTRWLYSNFNTYMVSCAIERRAGQNLTEYLKPRLFTPLGIGNPVWTFCPMGHVHAANGLYLNIDELAAYGRMLCQRGRFEGKQLVSENYLLRATSKLADDSNEGFKKQGCRGFGYGYQFWMNPEEGSFRNDGKYGQYCLVYPKQQVVIAIMSFEENTQALEQLIWKELVRRIIREQE